MSDGRSEWNTPANGGVGSDRKELRRDQERRTTRPSETQPRTAGDSESPAKEEFTFPDLPLNEQLSRMSREFSYLQSLDNPRSPDFTTSMQNQNNNRYVDVLAFEKTLFPPRNSRLFMQFVREGYNNKGPSGVGCYINGNLIDLNLSHKFIACQAPLDHTIRSFYETILEYKVPLVVMLTQTIENDLRKAHEYWPVGEPMDGEGSNSVPPQGSAGRTEKPPTTGMASLVCGGNALRRKSRSVRRFEKGLTVSADPHEPYRVDEKLKLVYRPLIVSIDPRQQRERERGGQNSADDISSRNSTTGASEDGDTSTHHRVLVVQYTGWPDNGVPSSTESFYELLSLVRAQPCSAPVMVHCSAGIGRTGTFIGAYAAAQMIERDRLTDKSIPKAVYMMKKQRHRMVQRVEQYMFIYLVAMDMLGANTEKLGRAINTSAAEYQARLQQAIRDQIAARRK